MKRHIAGIFAILLLVTICWGQANTPPFDVKKSREELEIMKGILGTTLSFALQNSQQQASSIWRYSNINAFYLAGQGAVFVIPSSTLRQSNYISPFAGLGEAIAQQVSAASIQAAADEAVKAAEAVLSQVGSSIASVVGSGAGSGVGSGAGSGTTGASDSPGTPPAPPPPQPPKPPQPPQVNREELRKKISEAQEKVKNARETAEANRQKFLQNLTEAKGYLLEALANHGDSMTIVKPNEYIDLVLMTDDLGGERAQSRQEVISVQKSWITEYRSGKLTMDGFKQKVLQYSE
jgi:hypothetical protein